MYIYIHGMERDIITLLHKAQTLSYDILIPFAAGFIRTLSVF